jgi:hypothetical protein
MVRGIKSNLPYDVLTFTLSNGNTTTITCNLTSKERNESKVCYIQPIDLAVNNNNIKEIVNTARIDISPSLISKYIKDLNHVCDTVRIELNNERMVLTGLVEDKAVVSHFIKKGNTLGITIDDTTEGVPTKTISIKRLVLLNKCTNLTQEDISIFLSTGSPMIVSYPLSSLGTLKLVYI